jgi:hypothetical protein
MVSSLVLGMAMGGLYMLLNQTETIHASVEDRITERQSARVALNQFAKVARAVGFELKGVDDPISSAALTEFQFSGDVDNDSPDLPCGAEAENLDGGGAERTTYTFSDDGTQLTRTIECWGGAGWTAEGGVAGVVLASIVAGTGRFRYWDADGSELDVTVGDLTADQREDVRSVTLEFAILERSHADGGVADPHIQRMRVRMPNLD